MKKGLRRMYIAFLSPVVIAFLVAYLYPVLRTVQMSFLKCQILVQQEKHGNL